MGERMNSGGADLPPAKAGPREEPAESAPTAGLRVLFVEDSAATTELCRRELEKSGLRVYDESVATASELQAKLNTGEFDLVISDYKLAGWTGSDVLRTVQGQARALPTVIVGDMLGDTVEAEMIRQGAADFVFKDRLARLPLAVHRALREKEIREGRKRAEEETEQLVLDLRQRVQELSCLYSISSIIRSAADRDAMLREIVVQVAAGMQHPEIAHVRLRLDGGEYCTPGFRESCWRYVAELSFSGESRGQIEVFYSEKHLPLGGEPFLRDEGDLIQAIARMVGQAVEHQAAEEALRRSEAEYRALFENANDAIIIFDPETEVIFEANRRALDSYGFSREEFLGITLKKLTADVARGEQRISELMRDGSIRNFETVHFRRDGTSIPLLVNSSMVEYRGCPAVLSINRNITELKDKEQELTKLNRALQTSSQCNQALVRAAAEPELLDLICRTMVEVGGYVFAWVGYAQADGSIHPMAHAGKEDGYLSATRFRCDQSRLARGPAGSAIYLQEPHLVPDTRRDKDFEPWREEARRRGYRSVLALPLIAQGAAFGCLAIYAAEPNAFDQENMRLLSELAGNLAFGISALRTREQRERAEAEVRRNASQIRTIFESMTDGFIAIDREWRLIHVNGAAERMLGRARGQLLGRSFFQEFPEAGPGFSGNHLQGGIQQGKKLDYEAFYQPLGKWFEVHAYPSEIGMSIYFRDVTEHKLMEERLRQAQKMEAVGRLAGGVAHDFNNLLNIIIGYSDLLLERHQPTEAVRKIVLEVRKAGDRAAALTRQLLAFSRKQVLAPKVLDLNEVTRENVDMVRRLVGEDIRVETVCGAELRNVNADPGQLAQVLMNLAANARDAMPQGGTLTITTSNVEADQAYCNRHQPMSPGPYVMLAVSDTGTGMNEETRSHIFEPFFTTKDRGKGTGLGLATVYGIVKQSGGYIWVESEPGQGTRFRIYLPPARSVAPEAAPPPRAAADSQRGAETILVVEDEFGVRSLVREYFRALGYTVLEACDGEEALRVVGEQTGAIDLVITDVVMPTMGGPELAGRLKELRPHTRVLYISGYAQSSNPGGALEEGSAFLPKPFRPAELARKVREILDSRATTKVC